MAIYINEYIPDGQRMWQIGVNKKGEKMQIIQYQNYKDPDWLNYYEF